MQVASRFAIGVHILTILAFNTEADNTSEYMAGSIGVNPVIVRNIVGMLKRAKLVYTRQGVAGTQLAKPLKDITLLDVYKAVQAIDNQHLFSIHANPNPNCPIGANIQCALEEAFTQAQLAMENHLAQTTLENIMQRLDKANLEAACVE